MAVTATPIFTQTPRNVWAQLTTANTGYDGSGTLVTLFTAGANGAKVFEITIECEGTSSAAVVNLFIDTNGTGTTWRIFDSFTIDAVTTSTTTKPFRVSKQYDNFIMTNGGVIKATTTVTQNYAIHANVADF